MLTPLLSVCPSNHLKGRQQSLQAEFLSCISSDFKNSKNREKSQILQGNKRPYLWGYEQTCVGYVKKKSRIPNRQKLDKNIWLIQTLWCQAAIQRKATLGRTLNFKSIEFLVTNTTEILFLIITLFYFPPKQRPHFKLSSHCHNCYCFIQLIGGEIKGHCRDKIQ